MIVSEVPGTTRDSVDSLLTWHRKQFRIVDTAGIRRPGAVSKSGQVETLSVMLAKRAIGCSLDGEVGRGRRLPEPECRTGRPPRARRAP